MMSGCPYLGALRAGQGVEQQYGRSGGMWKTYTLAGPRSVVHWGMIRRDWRWTLSMSVSTWQDCLGLQKRRN